MNLMFLVLEFLGIIAFLTQRMIIYGFVILLMFLPFYSELKFGDLSLKHDNEEKQRANL